MLSAQTILAAGGLSVINKVQGVFEGSSITKFYDADESVVCYVLHPDIANTHHQSNFSGDYDSFDGNNAGSISCVKK